MIILVDLDHTICDAKWRDPMIGVNTWDEYHAASCDDRAIVATCHLLAALHAIGEHIIVGITSRPSKWRQLTLRWMVDHGVELDDILMRDDEDYRQAPELKMELARPLLGDPSRVMLIEDRDDVVAAFRAAGVTCLQVYAP